MKQLQYVGFTNYIQRKNSSDIIFFLNIHKTRPVILVRQHKKKENG